MGNLNLVGNLQNHQIERPLTIIKTRINYWKISFLVVLFLWLFSSVMLIFFFNNKNSPKKNVNILKSNKYKFSYDYSDKDWRICRETTYGEWEFCKKEGSPMNPFLTKKSFLIKVIDSRGKGLEIVEESVRKECDKNFLLQKTGCVLRRAPAKRCNKNGVCCYAYDYQENVLRLSRQDEFSYCAFPLSIKGKILVFEFINDQLLNGLVTY